MTVVNDGMTRLKPEASDMSTAIIDVILCRGASLVSCAVLMFSTKQLAIEIGITTK